MKKCLKQKPKNWEVDIRRLAENIIFMYQKCYSTVTVVDVATILFQISIQDGENK